MVQFVLVMHDQQLYDPFQNDANVNNGSTHIVPKNQSRSALKSKAVPFRLRRYYNPRQLTLYLGNGAYPWEAQ